MTDQHQPNSDSLGPRSGELRRDRRRLREQARAEAESQDGLASLFDPIVESEPVQHPAVLVEPVSSIEPAPLIEPAPFIKPAPLDERARYEPLIPGPLLPEPPLPALPVTTVPELQRSNAPAHPVLGRLQPRVPEIPRNIAMLDTVALVLAVVLPPVGFVVALIVMSKGRALVGWPSARARTAAWVAAVLTVVLVIVGALLWLNAIVQRP